MKGDIENRADLETLLQHFYQKVFDDALIRHFFIEVVPLDLNSHLPVITNFWASVVLQEQGYRKNVLEVHQNINRLSPIEQKHLNRWVQLFTDTVDEYFDGPNAQLAKQRAQSIATMMLIKIHQPNPLKRSE